MLFRINIVVLLQHFVLLICFCYIVCSEKYRTGAGTKKMWLMFCRANCNLLNLLLYIYRLCFWHLIYTFTK